MPIRASREAMRPVHSSRVCAGHHCGLPGRIRPGNGARQPFGEGDGGLIAERLASRRDVRERVADVAGARSFIDGRASCSQSASASSAYVSFSEMRSPVATLNTRPATVSAGACERQQVRAARRWRCT